MAAFLTPDRVREEWGLTVREKLLPDGSPHKPNRPLTNGRVEHITIHNTDRVKISPATSQSEQYARATHNGNMNGVSVHYYVDEKDCWQLLRENEMGYHAADGYNGPGNCTTLAVEIIMDGSGLDYDRIAEDRGALLAALLLDRHGLTAENLTSHYRWYPKKVCPAYILPHWSAFKSKVETYLRFLQTPGDVDLDGAVTAADARLALRAAVGMETLTPFARAQADVDKDGKITPADAREILRAGVGKGV